VGIAGRAMQAKQSILVQNVQYDLDFYPGIDAITQLTTHSLIAVPLMIRNRVIGVIEIVNKLAGVFDQSDLDVLEALSSSAAIAIENARLFETTHRSQERYRHLFDDSSIPLWEEDH
jgi:GAF domain-containing protein